MYYGAAVTQTCAYIKNEQMQLIIASVQSISKNKVSFSRQEQRFTK